MSAGTPVWLSDIPPHHEVLRDSRGHAGEIVEDGNWAESIGNLCSLPSGRIEEMGAHGRAHVQAHFSWDFIADRTLEIYKDAIQDGKCVK
jgi:glycosyltransferase involved in cell wall biosynthesis